MENAEMLKQHDVLWCKYMKYSFEGQGSDLGLCYSVPDSNQQRQIGYGIKDVRNLGENRYVSVMFVRAEES